MPQAMNTDRTALDPVTRPLSILLRSGVCPSTIMYVADGWQPQNRLGDAVIQKPLVVGLMGLFPKAKLIVISGSAIPFKNIPGVTVRDMQDPTKLSEDLPGNSLLIGDFEPTTDVEQVFKQGADVLNVKSDGMWLFSRKINDFPASTFSYDKFNRLRGMLDGSGASRPSVPLSVRAIACDAGIVTPRWPCITPMGDLVDKWDEWLRNRVGTDLGKGRRTFYNRIGKSQFQPSTDLGPEAFLISELSRDSSVVCNPGDRHLDLINAKSLLKIVHAIAPPDKVVMPETNVDQDNLLALLASCDIVVTINTGVLHAASALDIPQRPLVIGRFESLDRLRAWLPENPTCFGINMDKDALLQAHAALKLLVQNDGTKVFVDERKAISDARAYVGLLAGLDPIEDMDAKVDPIRLNDLLDGLQVNIRPEYASFFRPLQKSEPLSSVPPWHSHTQQVMYRYCQNLLKRIESCIPAEKVEKLM